MAATTDPSTDSNGGDRRGSDERLSATEFALTRLRDLIESGSLTVGSRLPSEPELCAQIGVSRSSLRQATRTLITLGVLDARHGDGTYVTELLPGRMFRNFTWAMQLISTDGVLEILEIRRVLEAHAAARTAARMTEDLSTRLHAMLNEMDVVDDTAQLAELDTAFHQLINNAARNDALAGFLDALRRRGLGLRMYDLLPPELSRTVTALGHRAILDALDRQDPEGAAAAAAAHTQQTETWVRSLRSLTEHPVPKI